MIYTPKGRGSLLPLCRFQTRTYLGIMWPCHVPFYRSESMCFVAFISLVLGGGQRGIGLVG